MSREELRAFLKDTMEKFPTILEALKKSEDEEKPKSFPLITYYYHGQIKKVQL
jgi:hypothetical protein